MSPQPQLARRCPRLSSRSLATAAWSTASLRQHYPQLLAAIAARARVLAAAPPPRKLQPLDAIHVAWCLAELQLPDPKAFKALAQVGLQGGWERYLSARCLCLLISVQATKRAKCSSMVSAAKKTPMV